MDSHLYRIPCRTFPTALAIALLSACGGGGGSGGLVRAGPPSITDPAPPPPPAPSEPCQPPLDADCVVAIDGGNAYLTNGRTSDHALVKQGDSYVTLMDGEFTFAGGTRIEEGGISMFDAVLRSDVTIDGTSWFHLGDNAQVEGNVDIAQTASLSLYGSVVGNVSNAGVLATGAHDPAASPQTVDGDYVQASTGTLRVPVNVGAGGALWVTGKADIAGMLELIQQIDWDYVPFPLPETPVSLLVLHADGGVGGTFDEWTSPGLFVEGGVRYEVNDVFFDASAISAESVMAAANVGDALTLESARRFDGLLQATGAAKGVIDPRALSAAQDRLLRSAAIVQRIDDYPQAVRTFDSLSGHGHVAVIDAYLQNGLQAAPTIAAHLDASPRGANGAWASQPATFAIAGGAFAQQPTFGYDLQFTGGTRVGSSVAWSNGTLDLAREGGVVHSRAPQFNMYVHRAGPRGYATGMVGFGRQSMDIERAIDLGGISQIAHARRDVDTTFGYVEAGRPMNFGGGRITPFAATHWSQARAGAFAEQGVTGFELVGDASLHERFGGDVGVRWSRDWKWASGHWLRLDAGARHRHLFDASDFARVSYVGAPGWMFDLRGAPIERDVQAYSLGLFGGRDAKWAWSLRWDSFAKDSALSLAFARGF